MIEINKIHCCEALDLLRRMKDNSVDSIVTDPPAGISFMGKEWDQDKGGRDQWIKWMEEIARECNRVLKDGGHAFVWALPRTQHWTATAWENAGFEVRDVVHHIFGSGFPKSLDISKAIEKEAGVRPIGKIAGYGAMGSRELIENRGWNDTPNALIMPPLSLPEAIQWDGWGTALKPAVEDWILLRKPISERTIAQNILKHGTGGLNIDGSRVEHDEPIKLMKPQIHGLHNEKLMQGGRHKETLELKPQGRWPANLIHDGSEEVVKMFPNTTSGKVVNEKQAYDGESTTQFLRGKTTFENQHGDSGSAARFFYVAKPSQAERGEYNIHPTVKPLMLMRHLVKMITPPNGIVLDPFAGSGTTCGACIQEGFRFLACEKETDSVKIAERRIEEWQEALGLFRVAK